MQEVMILRGGTHYYHDKQGNPKDCYNVNPDEQARSLQCFVGHSLSILGHFPGADSSALITEIKVSKNNVVACIEAKQPT